MYINYEYYRVFYYAAQCGNLTKAAALLQNSQPNLTRAIKTLEAELGCTLFSRTNRGLILTPEGEALYRHIRVAFAEIEAGEAAVTQSRTLERGSVFLAASEGALRCLLLPVLREFCTRYPGVHLRISNHSTPQAVAALHETTADFAVAEQIRYAELHTQAVSHRIWLSIGILLLLIPAAAIFKLIDKISVICIRRLHG